MNVLRLTLNNLREQRWPIVGLMIYAALMLGLFAASSDAGREELSQIVRQQAGFGAAFGVLLASSALSTELRTRRILGVLSKAVSRTEYLGALVLASWSATLLYLVVACVVCLLFPSMRPVLPQLPSILLNTLCISLVGACAVTCFSIFIHPFFAAVLGVSAVMLPGAWAGAAGVHSGWISPAYQMTIDLYSAAGVQPNLLLATVVHAAGWFAIAVLIFHRRDVAVATD